MSLVEIVKKNDEELRKREDALITTVDAVYEMAIKNLIKRFKELEELSPDTKVSNEKVRELVDQIGREFGEKYQVLVEPLRKAMYESYIEGMNETVEFLKQASKELEKK